MKEGIVGERDNREGSGELEGGDVRDLKKGKEKSGGSEEGSKKRKRGGVEW